MTEEAVSIPMAEYRLLAAIHVHAAEMANLLERQRDDDAVADVLSRYDRRPKEKPDELQSLCHV